LFFTEAGIILKLQVRQINDLDTLNSARALLYHYYVEVLKWNIEVENPSGIVVKNSSKGLMLVDNYDECSDWFGLFNEKELIGCVRLHWYNKVPLLEIEQYAAAKENLDFLLSQKKELKIVEFNREAIMPKFSKNKEVLMNIMNTVFLLCQRKGASILTTTNIAEWQKLYEWILFEKLANIEFKYSPNEPKPTTVYFAQPEQIKYMLLRMQQMNLKPHVFAEASILEASIKV
tara:strand:+ start:158 stop:853 length:696 start_codon:yes stop_codon:yes gene_type:complete